METLHILQHYWWAIVSLLGALLVFLLFVQGGQTLLYGTARTEEEKKMLLSVLGHKWEITFTTLVTFGGAAFASFPLFYSTSFGGAYWLWMLILLLFVLQAVSYEFRGKASNLLGAGTYDTFLFFNGMLGTVLLGVAVGTLYSGGAYYMDKFNIADQTVPIISYWANGWNGLDMIAVPFNLLLGLVVFLAARTLGLLFVINVYGKPGSSAGADAPEAVSLGCDLIGRCRKQVKLTGTVFVLAFVCFLIALFTRTGYEADPVGGAIEAVRYKYFLNMIQPVWPAVVLLVGVVLVLTSLGAAFFMRPDHPVSRRSFYITGAGVVLAVWPLLVCAAFNNTAYFHSTVNLQDSLTLYNSSSSLFTLKVMAYVSIAIPFVVWYIAAVWRKMTGGGSDSKS